MVISSILMHFLKSFCIAFKQYKIGILLNILSFKKFYEIISRVCFIFFSIMAE